jgi:ABC-type transporter Mla subunit MlaD
MPESGYNTRMNEDQQLLTVEESKQILFQIEKHKKTLGHFLQQLKTQTETIHKQGQIIKELKRQTGKTSKYFVMQQVFLRKGIKPHWWCNS